MPDLSSAVCRQAREKRKSTAEHDMYVPVTAKRRDTLIRANQSQYGAESLIDHAVRTDWFSVFPTPFGRGIVGP